MLSTDSPKTASPSSSMTSRKPRRLSRRISGVTGPPSRLVSLTGACVSAAFRTRTRVGREATDEVGDLATHRARHRVLRVGVTVDDRAGDELGDGAHLRLAHALRGDARRADPDAGRDVGLLGVEGDGVLVQGDARSVAARLRVDPGDHDRLE